MDLHWWGLDPIRVKVTGRSSRSTRVVLELGSGAHASDAAELLAGIAKSAPAQPWTPIGSVVLVAAGAGAHPGVGPAVDTVRQVWPAAAVTVVDETVAALAGAGLDPEPAACVVVHLDAEHTSVALVAARKVVASGVAPGGAQGLAHHVIEYLRAEHRLDVGLAEAWITAVDGGAFAPSVSPPAAGPHTVSGNVIAEDGTDQRWGNAIVPPSELRAVLTPAYRSVADLVAQVLRDAPPDRRSTADCC